MTLLHGFLSSAPCQAFCLMILIKWMKLLVWRISLMKLLTLDTLCCFSLFQIHFVALSVCFGNLWQAMENNGEVFQKRSQRSSVKGMWAEFLGSAPPSPSVQTSTFMCVIKYSELQVHSPVFSLFLWPSANSTGSGVKMWPWYRTLVRCWQVVV